MKNLFTPIIALTLLSGQLLAGDLLFKEYSLRSGESISKLINDVKYLEKEDRIMLIDESLRVNQLDRQSARKLPIGRRVLIPVSIFKHYEQSRLENAPVLEKEIADQPIIEDTISEKTSAIAKVQTKIIDQNKSNSTNRKFYGRVGLINTNVHTSDDLENANLQSISVGLTAIVNEKLSVGASFIKDVAEQKQDYKAEQISMKAALGYEIMNKNSISLDINAGVELRNYNFDGLEINGFGKLNQKMGLVGMRGSYLINDKYSLSAGFDFGIPGEVSNEAQSALELENELHYQLESSIAYAYQDSNQLYLSIAREVNQWSEGKKEIDYVSNLFTVGLIFSFQ